MGALNMKSVERKKSVVSTASAVYVALIGPTMKLIALGTHATGLTFQEQVFPLPPVLCRREFKTHTPAKGMPGQVPLWNRKKKHLSGTHETKLSKKTPHCFLHK